MRENQIKFQHASAQSEKRMIIRHVSEPHIALKVTKMERVPENVKRTIYSFLATDEEVVQPAGLSVSAPEANAYESQSGGVPALPAARRRPRPAASARRGP